MTLSLDTLDHLSKRYEIPTLCAAIANHAGQIVAHPDTSSEPKFPLYSITKTFISVCLLKLAEAGKIDLDNNVVTWIADAPEAHRYTIRQLLTNTSGLPDYFMAPAYDEAVRTHPQRAWTRDEFLKNTYKGKLLFEPGQGWMYSNLGFMFLKEIIEKATGNSLAQALAEKVFAPLGLSTCRVLLETSDWADLVPATSTHLSVAKHAQDVRGVYHSGWVAHGVVAGAATDVARFFYNVFMGGFLNSKSLREMKTVVRVPGEHPPAENPSYGLGIMSDTSANFGTSYAHGGGGPGYALLATYWQDIGGGIVIVALGNNEHANMSALAHDLATLF